MVKNYFQPFDKGTLGSDTFRIPAIYKLQDGTVMAAADMRYSHGQDSPNNIDTLLAFSADGYSEWEYNRVNYFDDYADSATEKGSASFIDTAIVQNSSGRIFILTDVWTSDGGYMTCKKGTGFITRNNKKHLLLTTGSCSDDIDTFGYYVGDFNGSFAPVMKLDNSVTEYSVDEEMRIYKNGEALYQKQKGSDIEIQQNVYYDNSYFSAYRTCYLWLRYSDDNGKTWSAPVNISAQIKNEFEGFLGIGPGRGATVNVNGKERILFCLYDNNGIKGFSENVCTIYSDDNGLTWHRGKPTKHRLFVGKTSESQIITLPDGKLRIYARNAFKYVCYADSTDGGITWTSFRADLKLSSNGNCMVSFINTAKKINGRNVILGSYSSNTKKRADGVVAVGLFNDDNSVDWISKYRVNDGFFAYSCITELSDGNFGYLYEDEAAHITYKILQLSDDGVISDINNTEAEIKSENTDAIDSLRLKFSKLIRLFGLV